MKLEGCTSSLSAGVHVHIATYTREMPTQNIIRSYLELKITKNDGLSNFSSSALESLVACP
jgi:hypothetical protein